MLHLRINFVLKRKVCSKYWSFPHKYSFDGKYLERHFLKKVLKIGKEKREQKAGRDGLSNIINKDTKGSDERPSHTVVLTFQVN